MGIGFLSNNVMLPILDFFYGLVPSYGLAIVALTLVIRFALYPLSAGSIRNARRMKIANPELQKRQQAIKERYKDDPTKQQEELAKLFQEFGNPLSGCLPLIVQMPVLFALFATLRGSPFADIPYTFNLQIVPQDQVEQVQPKAFTTKPQNLYVTDGVHYPIIGILPGGNRLGTGEQTRIQFQTETGTPLREVVTQYPDTHLKPVWTVTKGDDRVRISEDGVVEALEPGDVTLQAKIPGLASNRGFLFIKALGRVGITAPDGTINWDILVMVLLFGGSLFVSQSLSGQGGGTGNPQQDTVNKLTPIMISGMFLFFPLPAGVLMYMVIANIFQTAQTFILSREPLPENLQKILDEQNKAKAGEERLPFEPVSAKKLAEETSGAGETSAGKSIALKTSTPTSALKTSAPKTNSPKPEERSQTPVTKEGGVPFETNGVKPNDSKPNRKTGSRKSSKRKKTSP